MEKRVSSGSHTFFQAVSPRFRPIMFCFCVYDIILHAHQYIFSYSRYRLDNRKAPLGIRHTFLGWFCWTLSDSVIMDTVNLESLMVTAYNLNLQKTPFFQSHCLTVPEAPDIPFRADPRIIDKIKREWGPPVSFPWILLSGEFHPLYPHGFDLSRSSRFWKVFDRSLIFSQVGDYFPYLVFEEFRGTDKTPPFLSLEKTV